MKAPVIVMGMHKSGTTLVAEMLHRAGTPMVLPGVDPDYDSGTRYERRITQIINMKILGARDGTRYLPALMPIWEWPQNPFPTEFLPQIEAEIGDENWGFKDPRTTVTYPTWAQQFPEGARFYVYRSHREFLRRCFKKSGAKSRRLWRARREFNAWFGYNDCILRNFALDAAAHRPRVVLRYEELMRAPELVERAAQLTGVPLFDARNFDMRRTVGERAPASMLEKLYLMAAEVGNRARLKTLYEKLAQIRLAPTLIEESPIEQSPIEESSRR